MIGDRSLRDKRKKNRRGERDGEKAGSGRRRILFFALCLFALACVLGACGDKGGMRVVFTTGFGRDEVFRIGSAGCTRSELMVYLTNTQNRYENVYGEEIWNVARGEETLEENVRETVLARVAQIKTMCLLAASMEVKLDETQERLAEQAARDYYASLNETELRMMGVTEETVRKLYAEYALANKVYRYIIQDINPEISDDEARTITVQHILLRTWTTDGSGARVTYEEDVKESVREKANEIRRLAAEEGEDFVDLASRYSEDTEITFYFGKGEMEAQLEEAAFSLETNEISRVVETENGYYIIKCISTFDREQTEVNKLEIVEQRRKEVFGEEYDAFVETLVHQLNTKVWDEIAMIHDENVTTSDFFEIYAKYFPD